MQKTVKYVGFFASNLLGEENRSEVASAHAKMDYIAKSMAKQGILVKIISPSWTINKNGYYRKKNILLSKNITLQTVTTFGSKWKIGRGVRFYYSLAQLIVYLLFHCEKGECVLVYHSLYLKIPIQIVRKIKKIKLFLEVEEIYSHVNGANERKTKKEINFLKKADSYIFPTELLNEKINIDNKPYAIIHGTYQVEPDRKCKFDDDRIHCVYAGTFDPRKGGAAAAAAAAYLDANYHIHIIGFGSEADTKGMQDLISKIVKNTECLLTYDGLLKGEEYIKFIQSCHVGLSTQTPTAEFNETSFPSKVLSYVANGLRVVSIRIKALETSAVDDLLYYYEEDRPEAIAEAIKKINVNDNYDSKRRINELDKQFLYDIDKLFLEGI